MREVMRAGSLYTAVAAGSAAGAVVRYLLSIGLLVALGPAFPWGTLAANGLGSFLMGLYAALTRPGGRIAASLVMRQLILAGFCGGFTTFSIFSLEALMLLETGVYGLATIYAAGSLVVWLTAVWAGWRLGLTMNGRRSNSD